MNTEESAIVMKEKMTFYLQRSDWPISHQKYLAAIRDSSYEHVKIESIYSSQYTVNYTLSIIILK